MAATIWENIEKIHFFQKNTCKTWWSYHDHSMNHVKHGNYTMIRLWVILTMPRNMAAMPLSWHDHDHVWLWSWYDHAKIMAWQPCFSNSGKSESFFNQFNRYSIVVPNLSRHQLSSWNFPACWRKRFFRCPGQHGWTSECTNYILNATTRL